MNETSPCTVFDVAERAGVSITTVSRVLTNHHSISPETVVQVWKAIEQTGYNPLANSLRKGNRSRQKVVSKIRHRQIGLVSQMNPSLFHAPVYAKLIRGISRALDEINFNLVIRNLPEKNAHKFLPKMIDGAIVFKIDHLTDPLIRRFRSIPSVRIMGMPERYPLLDQYTYDDVKVGQLASDYFLSKGHRSLVCIGPSQFDRINFFVNKVNEVGAVVNSFSSEHLIKEEQEAQIINSHAFDILLNNILSLPQKVTGIFCYADIVMLGMINAMARMGLQPGRDMDILGVNNDEILIHNLIPRPSSIDIHAADIGYNAVKRLIWRMQNPKELLEIISVMPHIV